MKGKAIIGDCNNKSSLEREAEWIIGSSTICQLSISKHKTRADPFIDFHVIVVYFYAYEKRMIQMQEKEQAL